MYEHLDLGDFERYRPRLRQYLADKSAYRTNTYEMTPEERAIIAERWGEFIDRYGYGAAAEDTILACEKAAVAV
jgi:hypothetical protein